MKMPSASSCRLRSSRRACHAHGENVHTEHSRRLWRTMRDSKLANLVFSRCSGCACLPRQPHSSARVHAQSWHGTYLLMPLMYTLSA